MEKTIKVTGVGKISAPVDYVEINLSLSGKDEEYEKALSNAGEKLESLKFALAGIGIDENSLKTRDFSVRKEQKRVQKENGNFEYVFDGFVCVYALKLGFDFSNELLGKVISAVSSCGSEADFSVVFTVKNKELFAEKLLEEAAKDARRKAEILCKASFVKLGELLSIDYCSASPAFSSRTNFEAVAYCKAASPDLSPEDVESSETAEFIFAIE